MNTHKALMAVATGGIILGAVVTATAQPPGPRGPRGDAGREGGPRWGQRAMGNDRGTTAILEGMARRLDLTDDQKAKVGAILEKTRAEVKSNAEGGKDALENAKDEIAAVLTPEQKEKAKDLKQQLGGAVGGFMRNHASEIRERMEGAGEEIRLRMALGSLNLTQEQRDKLKDLQKQAGEERKRIMEEMKPKMEALRTSVTTELESVLTPEQKEQMKKRLDEMPRPGRGRQ